VPTGVVTLKKVQERFRKVQEIFKKVQECSEKSSIKFQKVSKMFQKIPKNNSYKQNPKNFQKSSKKSCEKVPKKF
jgi:cell fate (sporulation/competence/biofilm development) regulator YlbF (YheA/YmcA/DUF963 family)